MDLEIEVCTALGHFHIVSRVNTDRVQDLTSLLEELPEYFQTECKLYRLLSRAIEDQRTADMNGHSWTSHPDQPSVSGDFLQCGGGLYQAVECPFLMSEDQDLHAWVRKDEQYKLGDLLAEVWFEPRVENPPVVQSDPDDGVEETSTGPDQESAISKDTTKGIDDRVYWEKWCLEKQVEYLLYLENIYLVDASAAFLDLGFTAAAAGRSHTLEMKTGVFQWDKNWLQGWQ